jgi:hypothetical protein
MNVCAKVRSIEIKTNDVICCSSCCPTTDSTAVVNLERNFSRARLLRSCVKLSVCADFAIKRLQSARKLRHISESMCGLFSIRHRSCIVCFILQIRSIMLFTSVSRQVPHAQLNGTLPSSTAQLSDLTGLALYFNTLRGAIPSELGSLRNLRDLDLSFNEFQGTIPTCDESLLCCVCYW